eukprot:g66.t1
MRIVSDSAASAAGSVLEQESAPLRPDRLQAEPLRRPATADGTSAASDAAERSPSVYRILVRDLDIAWSIGVYDHEHEAVQPIRINLELEARDLADWEADDYAAVPCYARIAERIRALAAAGHVQLVETLAHRIAALCLEDARVLRARVRVEKPEALKTAESVGVEIERSRT